MDVRYVVNGAPVPWQDHTKYLGLSLTADYRGRSTITTSQAESTNEFATSIRYFALVTGQRGCICLTLVWPLFDYCAPVRHSRLRGPIDELEKSAARFVKTGRVGSLLLIDYSVASHWLN